VLASFAAIAVVGVAGSSVASAGKLTPAQRRQQQEGDYIEKAVLPAINSAVCKPACVPATVSGPAPASFTSILGVLRLPPSSADTKSLSRPILSHTNDLYVDDVRLARQAYGIAWYVYVAGTGFLPPANVAACLAAQTANFSRELPMVPNRLRAGTKRMFSQQLTAERRDDARTRPPGICLTGFGPTGGGGGCGGTAAQIEDGRFVITGGPGIAGNRHSGTVQMIVPDGVASVTLRYPPGPANGFTPKIISPAFTLSTRVVNNVMLANVPRNSGGGAISKPTVMVWRAADGHIIKTFHGTL
jgi:hypothetical protein